MIRLSIWAILALVVVASEDNLHHEKVLEYARANGAEVSWI